MWCVHQYYVLYIVAISTIIFVGFSKEQRTNEEQTDFGNIDDILLIITDIGLPEQVPKLLARLSERLCLG